MTRWGKRGKHSSNCSSIESMDDFNGLNYFLSISNELNENSNRISMQVKSVFRPHALIFKSDLISKYSSLFVKIRNKKRLCPGPDWPSTSI